ncbi:MAG: 30S ribosomal protein S8 [Candidatus Sungbacteria bacterium RIFCSPLOWO2_01_FULL_47_10]|uniref:Small ribosomal subunit protein uS8 n=1 Tax=Candidatus Sungbacteria bacterium RIFCSPLOWO2_01_FULL_47_10 TaxID=1802276 RepID=A0A1G2L5I3_9BACT|nr:MAG: 30S ribosomal protein S8 [Candidatus Sungbacteria bacterium RIFCSPLOWO2_01_FULL_47_10]
MDPIGNMLTHIRNAYRAGHKTAAVSYSRINNEIVSLLKKNKFIEDFEKKGKKNRKFLELTLLYKEKQPAIEEIRRISKPSRRVYVGKHELYSVRHGHGYAIISTPQGIMTNTDAKKLGIGGEVMAEVW